MLGCRPVSNAATTAAAPGTWWQRLKTTDWRRSTESTAQRPAERGEKGLWREKSRVGLGFGWRRRPIRVWLGGGQGARTDQSLRPSILFRAAVTKICKHTIKLQMRKTSPRFRAKVCFLHTVRSGLPAHAPFIATRGNANLDSVFFLTNKIRIEELSPNLLAQARYLR